MNRPACEPAARNRAAVAAQHPHLLELLDRPPDARYRRVPDAEGLPVILASTDAGERPVGFASMEEVRRWLWEEPLERTGCGTLFAFGLGDGAHLPLLLERLPPHAQLFLLEPSPGLAALLLQSLDLCAVLLRPHTHVLVGPVEEVVPAVEASLVPARLCDHPTTQLVYPHLAWLAPGYVEHITSELLRVVDLLALESGVDLLESDYSVEHTLENALEFAAAPGIDALAGVLEGQSVVVLSEGPALAGALPLLSRHRHRVIVLATPGALRSCLAGGVAPDMVVCLDPMPESDHHFHQLDVPDEVFFVMEPRVLPLTWQRASRRAFTGVLRERLGRLRGTDAAGGWLERALGRRGELCGRGSATLALAALAVHLGAGAVHVLEPDIDLPAGRSLSRAAGAHPAWTRMEDAWKRTAHRQLAALAATWPMPVRAVGRGVDWPGLASMSLAEALTGSWADAPDFHARLRRCTETFRPTDPRGLLAEIERELYDSGDYPIPALAGVVSLLAQRARREAERLRLAAQLVSGGGRRRAALAAAALREEEGLLSAHRRLRGMLARLQRRLHRRVRAGGTRS